jgi:DNA-binding winged helix-turn-helix (wHTH) protein
MRSAYLFSDFTLQPATRLLRRSQAVVPIPSKAFDVLLALVQNAGRVMGKDELLRQVWPEADVEESNLTQAVFVLRKALGDTVRDHRFIVTVPKRGYSFVADVREVVGHAGAAAPRGHAPRRSEAQQLCLKGRHFWSKRTAAAVEKAIACYQQALDVDAACAQAHSGLADCYAILSHYSRLSPLQTLPRAKAAAIQALQIDETLAEAHASLGLVLMLYDWDWAAAGAEFDRALARDPDYATAHHWHGVYLAALGRFDEAVREMDQARHLDALSLSINTDLGLVLYLARRYDEAVAQYRAALDLDPAFVDAREGMLMASNEMGMYAQPISELMQLPEAVSRETASRLEAAYANQGVRGYWRTYLELADAPSSEIRSSPYVRARLHARLGEPELALQWLEAAYAERDGGLSLMKVDPGLDTLRPAPRFARILHGVGLA